jgi:PAS domain S-box-containing protein
MTDQTRPEAGPSRRRVATSGRAGDQRRRDIKVAPQRETAPGRARFEDALRAAAVYVFSQDKNLQSLRVHSPPGAPDVPGPDGEEVLAIKRKVLASGEPQEIEAFYTMPEGRVLFWLRVDPAFGPDGKVDGIACRAIDITRMRSLDREQTGVITELQTMLQRYETALRGSDVTVFTQDPALRYTSISNPFFGREVREIIGHADEEIVPGDNAAALAALKRAALDSGLPKGGEVRINDGNGIHWYDLHIEPVRDGTGAIAGLTCTAVDITERKEGEAHLRLLMRELTHRSKNLLAVIQAMARQTARHSGSIDSFLDQFGARLQALARSHDLLVQEEWHGVPLAELVRSQLAPYLDRGGSQIAVDGPNVMLRPEAAQSLGLALHELAINAVKFGALSTPSGRISIAWAWKAGGEPAAVEIVWAETGGPTVSTPVHRGFGSLVVERTLARALEAGVELSFDATGVRCRILIPVTQLLRPVEKE